ncbi:YybH family protein [Jiangella alkaliphila]|uniref:DUF4440 domain-containing protein n=1 Tax=Jiangella alkaliphila TaxID=419479 RepID=A0A1H2M4U1_9ACTN|nr:nuclear transport factor 2 family protein [Jiangella alkaliphila]SDU87911.1 protein of unknown function [Jiangella alkaliphila]
MTLTAVLDELDHDIWRAYRHAFGTGDAERFLALHDPELIRAGGPTKQVQSFAEYAATTRQWFADLSASGDRVTIDFRFTERLVNAGLASEQGVYGLTAIRATGETKTFHGHFHTFSRKSEGRWRILADYDTDDHSA